VGGLHWQLLVGKTGVSMKVKVKVLVAWGVAVAICGSTAIASPALATIDNSLRHQTVDALDVPQSQFVWEQTCTQKLIAFIDATGMNGNNLFRKRDRDYFETVTGCIVEETNAVVESTGLYADEFFPGIQGFDYEIIEARPAYLGGSWGSTSSSAGSIPSWWVKLRIEFVIEDFEGWGLCAPGAGDSPISFSRDYGEASWPKNAGIEYQGEWQNSDFVTAWFGWPNSYWARYAVSFEKLILVSDQQGPVVEQTIWACGYDEIFENVFDQGYHRLDTRFYVDPADLKSYNIPFYTWMGW